HTRWPRDWSSDVCSSDSRALKAQPSFDRWPSGLPPHPPACYDPRVSGEKGFQWNVALILFGVLFLGVSDTQLVAPLLPLIALDQIGRASCRERLEFSIMA